MAVEDYVRAALDRSADRRAAESATSGRVAELRDIDEAPQRAEEVHRALVAALGEAGRLDVARVGTDARDRANADAQRTAAEALAALRERVDAAAAGALDWAGRQGPTDTGELLLAELRQGRAWDRARSRLGGGLPARQIVDGAREAGDHDTLSALRMELPAYLDGLGDDDRARLGAGGSAVGEVLDLIEQALAEVLPEAHGQREAQRTRLAATAGAAVARRAIDGVSESAGRYADPADERSLPRALRALDVRNSNEAETSPGGGEAA